MDIKRTSSKGIIDVFITETNFNNAKIIHYFNHRLKDGPTKYNEGVPYELYETRLIKNFKKIHMF